MRNPSKDRTSAATKARRVARMLADTLRASQRPGGYITLDKAFRELEERERSESAEKLTRSRRTSRRS
jgi:hypothetical protein